MKTSLNRVAWHLGLTWSPSRRLLDGHGYSRLGLFVRNVVMERDKLKLGDRVEVINGTSYFEGFQGEIVGYIKQGHWSMLWVRLDNYSVSKVAFFKGELRKETRHGEAETDSSRG